MAAAAAKVPMESHSTNDTDKSNKAATGKAPDATNAPDEITNSGKHSGEGGVTKETGGDKIAEKNADDPGTPLGDENVEEDEDSDDDDVQITIGDIRTNVSFRQPARASFQPNAAAGTAKGQASKLDMDAVGMVGSKSVFDVNFDALDDKPWRKPGADLTDYFNYGFTEDTFIIYCDRQRRLRDELGSVHAANRAIFAGAGPLNILNDVTKKQLQKPAQIIPPVNLMGALSQVQQQPPPHSTHHHQQHNAMPLSSIAAATPVPLTAATPTPMEQPPLGMDPREDGSGTPGPGGDPGGNSPPYSASGGPPPDLGHPGSMFMMPPGQQLPPDIGDVSSPGGNMISSSGNNFPLPPSIIKAEPGGGGNGGMPMQITVISQPTSSIGLPPGSVMTPPHASSSIQTLVSSVSHMGGGVLISGSAGPGGFQPLQIAPGNMQFGAGPPIVVRAGPPPGAGVGPPPGSVAGTAIPVLNSQPERLNMALPPPSFAPTNLQFPPPGFNPGQGPPPTATSGPPGQPGIPGGLVQVSQGIPRPFPPGAIAVSLGHPGGPPHPQHGIPPGSGGIPPQHMQLGAPRLLQHPQHPGAPTGPPPQQNPPGMPPPGTQGLPPRSHPPPPGVHLGGPPPGYHNPNFPPPRPNVMQLGPPPNFSQQPRQFMPPGQIGIRPGWDPMLQLPERDRDRSPASYSDKSSDVEDRESSVRPRERRDNYREREFRRESRPRGGSAERRSPSATHHRIESSSRRHRGSDGSGHRSEREHRSGRERDSSNRYRSRSPHERSSGLSTRREGSETGPDAVTVKREKVDEAFDQRSPEKRKKSSKRRKDTSLETDEAGRSRDDTMDDGTSASMHRSSRSKVKKDKKRSRGGDDSVAPPGTGSIVKQEPKD